MPADIAFELEPGTTTLYTASGAGGPWAWFTLPQGSEAGARLTLEETWDLQGSYVFLPKSVAPTPALASGLAEVAADNQPCRFMWVADPSAQPLEAQTLLAAAPRSPGDPSLTAGQSTIALGTLALTVQGNVEIDLPAGNSPTATFEGTPAAQLSYGSGQQLTPVWDLQLDLAGSRTGLLRFTCQMDGAALWRYGGDVRFHLARSSGGSPVVVRLPLLDLAATGRAPGRADATRPTFGGSLDPLAPLDPDRTRFVLERRAHRSFLRTPTGVALDVEPGPTSGFALACSPDDDDSFDYYLTPAGPFRVLDAGGAPPRIACGLAGAERLALGDGSALGFVPGSPAFAPSEPARGPWLLDRVPDAGVPATTAWCEIVGGADSGYHAQPSGAVLHGAPVARSSRLVAPSDVLVRPAGDGDGVGATPAFPLAPLAGAAPSIATDVLGRLETGAVAPQRRACLPATGSGPVVGGALDPAPTGRRRRLRTAPRIEGTSQADRYAVTPAGVVAAVRADGLLSQIVLGREPGATGVPGSLLTIGDGTAALDPLLANALMSPQLCLVASQGDHLGPSSLSLSMQGFTFDLAPRPSSAHDGVVAILLLKFTPGRLLDLVSDPGSWTQPSAFNAGDGSAVAATLKALVSAALADDDPLLEPFRQLAGDDGWRGTLVLQAGLGPGGLPTELQGLRGGMAGPLRAHHLALPASHVDPADPLATVGSSFEGVIRYTGGKPPVAEGGDPTFTVLRFAAGFAGSTISSFGARAWLTLPELFGRTVRTPDGGAEIDGSYQRHGDAGTFVFAVDGGSRFEVDRDPSQDRVLRSVGVAAATFTTLTCTPDPVTAGALDVTARVSMSGTLEFDPQPFAGAPDLDPFGYRDDPASGALPLPYTGLDLDLAFSLTPGDDSHATPPALTTVPRLTLQAPTSSATGSLLSSFPLTPSAFLYEEAGLTVAKLGGQAAFTPQYGDPSAPVPVPPPEPATPDDGIRGVAGRTSAPPYALQFSLPLGTLGALSSVHVGLVATLTVGWGPSPTSPEQDAFGVFIALPQVIPGFRGFNLQGFLKTAFGTANLLRFDDPEQYVLSFSNVTLDLLSLKLPPGYLLDVLVFGDPTTGGAPSTGAVGWLLSATRPAAPAPGAVRA